MALFTGGGLALFAYRARDLAQGGIFAPISREGALVLNNILLTTACATVLIGTLYPLALEALTGEKISVGAPYFNMTFGSLMLPLLLALPFGPLLAWKRGDVLGASQRLAFAALAAIVAIAVAFAVTHRGPVARAVRHCARRVGDGGCGFGGSLAVQAGPGAAQRGLAAVHGPAALGLRHDCSRISASG